VPNFTRRAFLGAVATFAVASRASSQSKPPAPVSYKTLNKQQLQFDIVSIEK
jgi:hypothetical protein